MKTMVNMRANVALAVLASMTREPADMARGGGGLGISTDPMIDTTFAPASDTTTGAPTGSIGHKSPVHAPETGAGSAGEIDVDFTAADGHVEEPSATDVPSQGELLV